MITATAIVMGKKYKGEGKTVREALERITIKNPKGKCVLTVSDGKNTKERVIMPAMAFRFLGGAGLVRDIALKNLSQIFV